MSDEPSHWWNKQVRIVIPFLSQKRKSPSPFARMVNKVIGRILLLLVCVFLVWRVLLGHEINTGFAKIRAAGLPLSGTELNHWRPAVPDDQNGALAMPEAFALLRTFPDKRSNQIESANSYLFRTNSWSEETSKLLEEYVQINAAALGKAREALTFSNYRYPADYSYGPTTELPHLAKLKTLANVSALHAVLDAEQGHAAGWSQYVEFQLQLAATLDAEPVLISQLVRYSLIGMAFRSTQRCLGHGGPTDEERQQLQQSFAVVGRTNTLPQALIGERALMIPAFRLSRSEIKKWNQNDEGDAPRKPQRYSGKPVWYLWVSGFFERDLNFYLQTMDEGIALAANPTQEVVAAPNPFKSAGKVATKKCYILSGLLLPSFSGVFNREATVNAQINLVVTALAVERFKNAHGRSPEKLQELTPEFLDTLPIDPFDGAPLRFRHLAHGYVIYSIGEDGHDDGGREAPEKRKSGDTNSYDITFTVETP